MRLTNDPREGPGFVSNALAKRFGMLDVFPRLIYAEYHEGFFRWRLTATKQIVGEYVGRTRLFQKGPRSLGFAPWTLAWVAEHPSEYLPADTPLPARDSVSRGFVGAGAEARKIPDYITPRSEPCLTRESRPLGHLPSTTGCPAPVGITTPSIATSTNSPNIAGCASASETVATCETPDTSAIVAVTTQTITTTISEASGDPSHPPGRLGPVPQEPPCACIEERPGGVSQTLLFPEVIGDVVRA